MERSAFENLESAVGDEINTFRYHYWRPQALRHSGIGKTIDLAIDSKDKWARRIDYDWRSWQLVKCCLGTGPSFDCMKGRANGQKPGPSRPLPILWAQYYFEPLLPPSVPRKIKRRMNTLYSTSCWLSRWCCRGVASGVLSSAVLLFPRQETLSDSSTTTRSSSSIY